MIFRSRCRPIFPGALLLPFLLLSTSCATQTSEQEGVVFVVEDSADREEIVVRLTNGAPRDVCIGRSNWPDDKGRVSESQNVALVVGQQLFPLLDMGHYDCFDFGAEGKCSHRLSQGESLIGRIPYDNFSLPASLRTQAKTLEYRPPFSLSNNGCRPIANIQLELVPSI